MCVCVYVKKLGGLEPPPPPSHPLSMGLQT